MTDVNRETTSRLAAEASNKDGPEKGLSRRALLRAGGVAGGSLALAGLSPVVAQAATGTARGAREAASGGKIIWIPPLLASFNLPIDVGFRDFTDAYGWTYQKISTGTTLDPASIISATQQAIQIKPDVLVLYGGINGLATLAQQAQNAGIKVLVNNTIVPELSAIGLSYVGQSFVGAGTTLGLLFGAALLERGYKKGVVLDGNSAAGNLATDQRHQGLAAGLAEFNAKHGTKYTTVDFLDGAETPATSLTLYAAKFKELGKNLIGIASTGVVSTVVQLEAVVKAGFKPGQYPMLGFDTAVQVDTAIKEGWIQATIDQQLYSQGYVAAALGWEWSQRDFIPAPLYDTGELVITKTNIDAVAKRDAFLVSRAKTLGISGVT
jgi:ABC-type sugar transport system substrate-binding protein